MAEEVGVAQKVDSPFSQRDKAKIKAMITIDMHVSDLKKALNFYVELLGFTLVRPPFHLDQDVEDNAIIRVDGGPNIILVKKPNSQNNGRSPIVFTYHTDDIEAVYSVLRDSGIRTNGLTMDVGSGWNVAIQMEIWFMCTLIDSTGPQVYQRL